MKHSALCFRPVSPGGVGCVGCCAVLIINAGFGFPGRVEDIPHYEVRYQFGVWPWLGAFGIRGGGMAFRCPGHSPFPHPPLSGVVPLGEREGVRHSRSEARRRERSRSPVCQRPRHPPGSQRSPPVVLAEWRRSTRRRPSRCAPLTVRIPSTASPWPSRWRWEESGTGACR